MGGQWNILSKGVIWYLYIKKDHFAMRRPSIDAGRPPGELL